MINFISEYVKYVTIIVLGIYIPNLHLRLFVFAILVVWLMLKTIFYYKSLPPGPWGVPILGYLPFMSNKPPHKLYTQMCNKYGDIFSVQLGTNLVIGIGSDKLMRELFNRADSTGRPKTPLNSLMGGLGIIHSEGQLWKRQRMFLHEKFRALGVKLCPNERFEKFIKMELEELFTVLDEIKGEAVNPHLIFGRHIHNVICQLMMNFRFPSCDKEFIMFNERITRGMKLFGMVHLGEHFKPYLYLPGKQDVIKEIKRNLRDVSKFHGDHLKQRVKQRTGSVLKSKPADLLDFYIDNMYSTNKGHDTKSQIFPGVEPEEQIIQTMNDLFSAGMETSLSTLLWCMVMMVREPTVADKVREEIKKSVTTGQLITMEHRLLMPYVEAVILETMRIASIVPLGTTHVNETEWHVEGYTIPAGSHIIPLISKMNMDPVIYPEPEQFKPERFIKEGKCHAANFLQFGVGQRMCLGNMLARMELFLFFANIMNAYEFALPADAPVPELDGVFGVTHTPLPFKLSFTKLDN